MVFIKSALLGLHVRIARPGFGNQHGHHVRQGAACLEKEFDSVVEVCGVAAAGRDDGIELLQVIAEQRGLQQGLARVHPVHVAFERVDFAVVRDVAIRMRELPAGKSVGGEALVHEAERARHIRIRKLAVEIRNLRSEQQAFVDDGACRERRNVEHAVVLHVRGGDFRLGPLANNVELALEGVFVHDSCAADENLLNVRLGAAGYAANCGGVDGRIPPAQYL